MNKSQFSFGVENLKIWDHRADCSSSSIYNTGIVQAPDLDRDFHI